jgi:hypothetical protein
MWDLSEFLPKLNMKPLSLDRVPVYEVCAHLSFSDVCGIVLIVWLRLCAAAAQQSESPH